MKRLTLLLTVIFMIISMIVLSNIAYGQDEPWIVVWADGPSADSNFESYRESLSQQDIAINRPEGYGTINMSEPTRRDFFQTIGFRCSHPNLYYIVGLQSPDGNAAFLYPSIALNVERSTIEGGIHSIDAELRSAHRNTNLDVCPLVDVIVHDNMSQYANADTVAIYHFELDKVGVDYMNKYNHCIGVYLRKYAHPGLLLKIMLNDEGYANRDKYLRELFANVKMGDDAVPLLKRYEKRMTGSLFDFNRNPAQHVTETDEAFIERTKPTMDRWREKYKQENDSLNRLDAVRIK